MATLTTFCVHGLCNRINVLTSGLALAEASGRGFRMLWPRTPHCGAAFQELFCNDWSVEEVQAQTLASLPHDRPTHRIDAPDLLAEPATDVVFGSFRSLLLPTLYPSHKALAPREWVYFDQLQPTAAIDTAWRTYQARYFRPRMIGIHLRRGDFVMARPDRFGNTTDAFTALDAALLLLPEAGIFLATDDGAPTPQGKRSPREGVRELCRRRYGDRVVWTTPRSLLRATPDAVQDALVDLWLLRQTDYFIGSAGSSFSQLAVYGRTTPHQFCHGMTSMYQRALWFYKISGLYHWWSWLGLDELHAVPSLAFLWKFYLHPRQRLARFLRWFVQILGIR